MEQDTEKQTVSPGFDMKSIEVGTLIENGGEPLRQWFARFMDWVVTSIGAIAERRGLEHGRKYYEETGRQIAKFLARTPAKDREYLERQYSERMRKVNLRYGMGAVLQMPIRSGEDRSLYLDHQPSRFENANEAVHIGGGKTIRYPGSDEL